MTRGNRPLSPHLQIYKPQLTSGVSIFHRITGVILAAGLIILVYWLGAAAYGPQAYARAQVFLGSWFGLLMLFAFTAALFYHICNGVRHLFWDIGWGFEKDQVTKSGIAVLVVTAVLTVVSWVIGLS